MAWDLNSIKPLPFEDNSFDAVLCTQVFEHLPLETNARIVKEVLRILKPKGVFRMSSPNVDLYKRALLQNDRLFFATMIEYYAAKDRWKKNFLHSPEKMDVPQLFLNAIFTELGKLQSKGHMASEDVLKLFYDSPNDALNILENKVQYDYDAPHFHVTYINEARMSKMFQDAGYSQHGVSGYCQSIMPVLRYVESLKLSYIHHNLYFEGVK